MNIYIVSSLFYALLKKFNIEKLKIILEYLCQPLDVDNAQEANSETGQVLSNKNKRALLFI